MDFNILKEFANFVELNDGTDEINDVNYFSVPESTWFWLTKGKPTLNLELMLKLLQRLKTEIDWSNVIFNSPEIWLLQQKNVVKAKIVNLRIIEEKNCFMDLDGYEALKTFQTEVKLSKLQIEGVSFKKEMPGSVPLSNEKEDIKSAFLTYLASIVRFVQIYTQFISSIEWHNLPANTKEKKDVKTKLLALLDLLNPDTITWDLLLNWLLITGVTQLLTWGSTVLLQEEEDAMALIIANYKKEMESQEPDLERLNNVLSFKRFNKESLLENFLEFLRKLNKDFSTELTPLVIELEETKKDPTVRVYDFLYSYKFPGYEYQTKTFVMPCWMEECPLFVGVGLPFCHNHLRDRYHLLLNAELGGPSWFYTDGVVADGNPETVVFPENHKIIPVIGEMLPTKEINTRYKLKNGLVDGCKYLPYTFLFTHPETKEEMWMDGSFQRGVAFMIREPPVPVVADSETSEDRSGAAEPNPITQAPNVGVIKCELNQLAETQKPNVGVTMCKHQLADGTTKWVMWVKALRDIYGEEELFIHFGYRSEKINRKAGEEGYDVLTQWVGESTGEESSQFQSFSEEKEGFMPGKVSREFKPFKIGQKGEGVAETARETGASVMDIPLPPREAYNEAVKSVQRLKGLQVDETGTVAPEDLLYDKQVQLLSWFNLQKMKEPKKSKQLSVPGVFYIVHNNYNDSIRAVKELIEEIEAERQKPGYQNYLSLAYRELQKYNEEFETHNLGTKEGKARYIVLFQAQQKLLDWFNKNSEKSKYREHKEYNEKMAAVQKLIPRIDEEREKEGQQNYLSVAYDQLKRYSEEYENLKKSRNEQ